MIIEQRRHSLAGGLEVGRVLPVPKRSMVGPYIFFDHIGPEDVPAGVGRDIDVRPHLHIGLSTVTYLFSGEIMHRDSLGFEQAIRPSVSASSTGISCPRPGTGLRSPRRTGRSVA